MARSNELNFSSKLSPFLSPNIYLTCFQFSNVTRKRIRTEFFDDCSNEPFFFNESKTLKRSEFAEIEEKH